MNYRPVLIAIVETVGLFVSGFVIPVLGQIIALFTPVPLILVHVRNGRTAAFISLVACSIIIGLLGPWQVAAVFFISFGLMAVGTAEGIRRNWKPESSALLGGLLPLVILASVTAYYFFRIGKNPFTATEQYLRASLGEAAKFYTQLGLTEMATWVGTISDTFVYYLVRLIPGVTVATFISQAACCYGLARAVIARRPGNAPALAPRSALAEWHAPDIWIWGLIAALALILVPSETARFIGWNLAIVYGVAYLVQGVGIVDHYLRKGRVRPFIRGMIHAIILALPSIVFVIALGVVDIWADFRKVRHTVQPLA